MKHQNLRKAAAALDDARTLLVDAVDDRPEDATVADYNNVDAGRQFINSAISYVHAADSDRQDDEGGEAL